MAPPLYSTFSAITELIITAAVVWFFWSAIKHGKYRWGIIAGALFYETMFNITYMTARFFGDHGPSADYAAWYSAFLAFHGILSLLMFIALVTFVIWAFDQTGKDRANPIGERPKLAIMFLALWGISILTGEIIYALQWTDLTAA